LFLELPGAVDSATSPLASEARKAAFVEANQLAEAIVIARVPHEQAEGRQQGEHGPENKVPVKRRSERHPDRRTGRNCKTCPQGRVAAIDPAKLLVAGPQTPRILPACGAGLVLTDGLVGIGFREAQP
jgi:hypothetical protein